VAPVTRKDAAVPRYPSEFRLRAVTLARKKKTTPIAGLTKELRLLVMSAELD
jgi:hypothetical protein